MLLTPQTTGKTVILLFVRYELNSYWYFIKLLIIRIRKLYVQRTSYCCLGFGLFLLLVCMLSLYTLQSVAQSEYAVEYNTYTCRFGKILTQGKYTTTVGTELIRFQRILQDLNLGTLTCLTQDKVLVELEINMQIQYEKDALIPIILKQFGADAAFADFLSSLATSSILNTCLEFNTEDYYLKRADIDLTMGSNINQVINISTVGTSLVFFQLINIEFPAPYAALILQKQTSQQLETTLSNNRQSQITNAETALFVANNTANIKIINAKQQAATVLNQAYTTQAVVNAFWLNRANSYAAIMNNFNYNNVSQLVDYINSETMRGSGKLVAGLV